MTEQIHVLYVDDDPTLLEIGKLYLERTGDYHITTRESVLLALETLEKQPFDAIISDYQMPETDGIEFLRAVRISGNSIPFILFTGRGREEVVIQALNEGADFYLQKGGDPKSQFAELAHKIKQAIIQRRLEASVKNHERREADIINFLPDPTFAINSNGIIIAWNRAMETLTGISSDHMRGKGNYEYALPFYRERRPLLLDLVLRDDPETYSKYSLIKRDGELLSAEITISHFHDGAGATFWFTASPLYDNQGTIVGAIESVRDITESKQAEAELRLDESRLEALLQLNQMVGESINDITRFSLEQAVRLTESTLGYIAFVNEDESVLTMHAWSKVAMQECQIQEKPLIYPVASTGLWGESLRQRRPVVTNDYSADNQLKKGTPDGHVHLTRHLSIPVFDGERIVALAGVGNKERIYGPSDIRQIELLMGGMWTILQRKQAKLTLLQNNEELHAAYEEISETEEELRSNLDELTLHEEALQESRRRLNSMATNIPGVVYRFFVNPDGSFGFDYISERSMQILGLENDPDTFFDQVTNGMILKDRTRFQISIQNAINNKCLWEFDGPFVKPSGEKIWLKAVSSPMMEQGKLYFDGVVFDITENKRAEKQIEKKHSELMISYEQLAATEEELRHSLDELIHQELMLKHQSRTLSILNGIISASNKADNQCQLLEKILEDALRLLDFDGGGIYIVNQTTKIAELSCSNNLSSDFTNEIKLIPIDKKPYDTLFIHNEPIITENYAQLAPGRAQRYGFQSLVSIPLLSKGVTIGALNLASTKKCVISDEEKQILEAVGKELGNSIERILAEEELRNNSKNLETLFNSIDEMIFVLDLQGCILAVNKAVQKSLSYTSEELIGTTILQLYEPKRRGEATQIMQEIINGITDSCSIPIHAKDGTLINVKTKVTRGWWYNQEVLFGVSRDVTE